jgi:hypothetical protein
MPDEGEIVILDTGEEVRVAPHDDLVLTSVPDPELIDVADRKDERLAKMEQMRQAKRDMISRKKAAQAADPAVPPEKTIF